MCDEIVVEHAVNDGGELTWFYCRGHVDKAAFLEAARAEFPDDLGEHLGHTPDEVRHTWYRNEPDARGDFQYRILPVDGPGRGAYAVTEIGLDD